MMRRRYYRMYSPQGGTPVRLGNCAVLVKVALADELVVEEEAAVALPDDGTGDVTVEL
jgi:hypothetical protein